MWFNVTLAIYCCWSSGKENNFSILLIMQISTEMNVRNECTTFKRHIMHMRIKSQSSQFNRIDYNTFEFDDWSSSIRLSFPRPSVGQENTEQPAAASRLIEARQVPRTASAYCSSCCCQMPITHMYSKYKCGILMTCAFISSRIIM